MEFVEDHFEAQDINDIILFAKFLERYDTLSLKNEVKTEQGNILIQSERNLTENLVKNLITRTDLAKDVFIINNNENLKMAIVNRISKEFDRKMDLSDYSFCSFLVQKSPLDFRRILRGSVNNNYFLGFMTNLIMNNYDITNHIIEIALMSIGLLNNTKDPNIDYSDLIKLFQASILHDCTIVMNKQWKDEDTFQVENSHDRDSAMAISDKKFAPEVAEIILAHNKLQNKYSGRNEEKWYNNKLELLISILNLSEYYTYIKRIRQSENDNEMTTVLYQLSLITEKGFFPRQLLGLFEVHFSNFASIFKYGQQIGKVEKMCVLKTSLASAYPKPKSTQVLCKNNTQPCEYRISSQPLKVVSEKKIGANITEVLNSGWYEKCKFGVHLPEPPAKI